MVTNNVSPPWQRARQPQQKEERRQAILAAAADLFAEQDYEAVSMGAIAQRAGSAKGNLYRYFSSKEELFLQLYLDSVGEASAALEDELAALRGADDPAAVARAMAAVLAARPRFLALLAIVSSILERNLPTETLAGFKESLLPVFGRLVAELQATLPGIDAASAVRFYHTLHALTAGLWPMANPAPDLEAILQRPHLRTFQVAFEPTLATALEHLLRGLRREGA
jgi:AcrR family transcriptional regulator